MRSRLFTHEAPHPEAVLDDIERHAERSGIRKFCWGFLGTLGAVAAVSIAMSSVENVEPATPEQSVCSNTDQALPDLPGRSDENVGPQPTSPLPSAANVDLCANTIPGLV